MKNSEQKFRFMELDIMSTAAVGIFCKPLKITTCSHAACIDAILLTNFRGQFFWEEPNCLNYCCTAIGSHLNITLTVMLAGATCVAVCSLVSSQTYHVTDDMWSI